MYFNFWVGEPLFTYGIRLFTYYWLEMAYLPLWPDRSCPTFESNI